MTCRHHKGYNTLFLMPESIKMQFSRDFSLRSAMERRSPRRERTTNYPGFGPGFLYALDEQSSSKSLRIRLFPAANVWCKNNVAWNVGSLESAQPRRMR